MKVLILSVLLLGFSALAATENYAIDGGHSSVVFKINHLGFSNTYGMFGDVSGDFVLDSDKADQNKLNVVIKTASITTLNEKRDDHLKKPDFFDAKQYPEITFKSESLKTKDQKTYEVKGQLTIHGVTKPLSFKLVRSRTGEDPMKKIRTGGETKFTIKRSDFGMKYMVGPNMVGDDVEMTVSMEGTRK